jgi:hypothetical protein
MSNPYQRRKARKYMTYIERSIDMMVAQEKAKTEGFIYFIECAGYVKVGFSIEPTRRAMAVQVSNPFDCRLMGTARGGTDDEKKYHERLSDFHHRGEWYILTDEVRAAIEALIEHERTSV